MIAIPFIYFTLILMFVIYKKGFNICAYLISLYVVISFFSILIDINELRSFDTKYYEISLESAIVYCLLLSSTFIPFYRINFAFSNHIKIVYPSIFDKIVYIYFANFIILLYLSLNSIIKILTGNLGELRKMAYKGESASEIELSGGILMIIINLLSNFSMIMLLFYFYSICFLNKSKKFNNMILVSSLSVILLGILGVDRSKTFYWMITYGAMVVLFWKYLDKTKRKKIIKTSLILISCILFYFISVTISRFGERESGTEGGIIRYAGQSFINFCMFYDQVDYPKFSLQKIFPIYYHFFIDNGIKGSVELNNDIGIHTGKFIGVFSTFLGDIMVGSGKIATFIFCFFYNLLAFNLLKFRKREIYFHNLLLLFCFISVPMLGIFVYFHSNYLRMTLFILFIFYGIIMSINQHKIK